MLDDVIEWDVPNWAVALEYWREHTKSTFPNPPSPVKAMEIGRRHGGLSPWAALNGMEVFCSDHEGPSHQAREKHKNGDMWQVALHFIGVATK